MACVDGIILKRLAAVKELLAMPMDEAKREEISAAQTIVIKALLAKVRPGVRTSMAPDDFVATAIERITETNLLIRDVDELVVATADTLPTTRTSKWKLQDYKAVFGFYTSADWLAWNTFEEAIQFHRLVFKKAVALGCRQPSEPTTKWWNSVVLAKLVGEAGAELMSVPVLKAHHDRLKANWKMYLANCQLPAVPRSQRIHALPATPSEMNNAFPELYSEVFTEEKPVIAQTNLDTAAVIERLYPCRGAAEKRANCLVAEGSGNANQTALANLVITGMRAVQDSQRQMMASLRKPVSTIDFFSDEGGLSRETRRESGQLALTDGLRCKTQIKTESDEPCQGQETSAESAQSRQETSAESAEAAPDAFGGVLGMLSGKAAGAKAIATAKADASARATPRPCMKRPSAADASSIGPGPCKKRPASAGASAGIGKVFVKAVGLPKGWTTYTVQGKTNPNRRDKYFVDPFGKQYRSMIAVQQALS